MQRGRSFQPNGKCGNCQSFRHSEKDKTGKIIEEAFCAKDLDPRTCQEFKSKSKRIKKYKKKKKAWQQEKR